MGENVGTKKSQHQERSCSLMGYEGASRAGDEAGNADHDNKARPTTFFASRGRRNPRYAISEGTRCVGG